MVYCIVIIWIRNNSREDATAISDQCLFLKWNLQESETLKFSKVLFIFYKECSCDVLQNLFRMVGRVLSWLHAGPFTEISPLGWTRMRHLVGWAEAILSNTRIYILSFSSSVTHFSVVYLFIYLSILFKEFLPLSLKLLSLKSKLTYYNNFKEQIEITTAKDKN